MRLTPRFVIRSSSNDRKVPLFAGFFFFQRFFLPKEAREDLERLRHVVDRLGGVLERLEGFTDPEARHRIFEVRERDDLDGGDRGGPAGPLVDYPKGRLPRLRRVLVVTHCEGPWTVIPSEWVRDLRPPPKGEVGPPRLFAYVVRALL